MLEFGYVTTLHIYIITLFLPIVEIYTKKNFTNLSDDI